MQIKIFLFYLISFVSLIHTSNTDRANTLVHIFLDEAFLQSPLVHSDLKPDIDIDRDRDEFFIKCLEKNIYNDSNFMKNIEAIYFKAYNDIHSNASSFFFSSFRKRSKILAQLQGSAIAEYAELRLRTPLGILPKDLPLINAAVDREIAQSREIQREIWEALPKEIWEALPVKPLSREDRELLVVSQILLNRQDSYDRKWYHYLKSLHRTVPFKLREWKSESDNIRLSLQRMEKIVKAQKKYNLPSVSPEMFSIIFRQKIKKSFEAKIARQPLFQLDSLLENIEGPSSEEVDLLIEPYIEEVGTHIKPLFKEIINRIPNYFDQGLVDCCCEKLINGLAILLNIQQAPDKG